ncbi:WXG100 family type VII secretion target [Nocardia mangyaensis]|uniref:WXG100 family type VII secretion target n=1 Tax=Nocardia mangyaensis TaxID=2213200 RepID=UPI002674F130|nr:WXG100 family type VII secretion target [Nocardia mangyaensis]MDO3650377.1 WXG100 family type VII secretion target [Nocardia mangyaensis]
MVPDEVQAVGRFVFEIAEALRTALDSASSEVDTLISGGWTGDAASQFSTGWTETRSGGTQICTALTTMAEKLGITAETYRNQDSTNEGSINLAGLDLPEL